MKRVSDGPEGPATRGAYLATVVALTLSIMAGLGLAVVYIRGGQAQLEGVLLGMSLLGMGVGLVIWAKRFLPNDEVEEERKSLQSDEDVAAFTTALEEGEEAIGSRRLIVGLIAGGIGPSAWPCCSRCAPSGPAPGAACSRPPWPTGFGW